MEYRKRISYALHRAREYVALNDMFLARCMTECAEKNMRLLQLSETQMNLTQTVIIPLNV